MVRHRLPVRVSDEHGVREESTADRPAIPRQRAIAGQRPVRLIDALVGVPARPRFEHMRRVK